MPERTWDEGEDVAAADMNNIEARPTVAEVETIAGLAVQRSEDGTVVAVATAAVASSVVTSGGSLAGLKTAFNEVLVTEGQEVLLTKQATESQNGPWIAHESERWKRPTWFEHGATKHGTEVGVLLGTEAVRASIWLLANVTNVVVDTTAQEWEQNSSVAVPTVVGVPVGYVLTRGPKGPVWEPPASSTSTSTAGLVRPWMAEEAPGTNEEIAANAAWWNEHVLGMQTYSPSFNTTSALFKYGFCYIDTMAVYAPVKNAEWEPASAQETERVAKSWVMTDGTTASWKGTSTNGSRVLTSVSAETNLNVGTQITSGLGFPAGTTAVEKVKAGEWVMSQKATSSHSAETYGGKTLVYMHSTTTQFCGDFTQKAFRESVIAAAELQLASHGYAGSFFDDFNWFIDTTNYTGTEKTPHKGDTGAEITATLWEEGLTHFLEEAHEQLGLAGWKILVNPVWINPATGARLTTFTKFCAAVKGRANYVFVEAGVNELEGYGEAAYYRVLNVMEYLKDIHVLCESHFVLGGGPPKTSFPGGEPTLPEIEGFWEYVLAAYLMRSNGGDLVSMQKPSNTKAAIWAGWLCNLGEALGEATRTATVSTQNGLWERKFTKGTAYLLEPVAGLSLTACKLTNGSKVIKVTSATGIEVGMTLTSAMTHLPTGTVEKIVGVEVTMTGTAAGATEEGTIVFGKSEAKVTPSIGTISPTRGTVGTVTLKAQPEGDKGEPRKLHEAALVAHT
jgi:hypothetical protein